MTFDDFVNFFHQSDGLVQGDDDLLVVGDVFGGEGAAFAVLQPLVAVLIAADVEVPHGFGDVGEACRAGLLARWPTRAFVFPASSQTVLAEQPTRPPSALGI